MPKKVNRLPGIKLLPSGNWQARVFHISGEESKNFPRQDDARIWQRNLKNDLDRCPEGIIRFKRKWVASLITPTGVASKDFSELDSAIEWRIKGLDQIKTGRWIDPDTADATLAVYVPYWLDNKVEISGKTLATYHSQLRVHILPVLGACTLPSIRNADIRGWISELTYSEVGATTIKQSFRLLKQILDSAVTDGRINWNPASGIKLPKQPKKKAQSFTPEQVSALAAECGLYGNLVHFLANTGLRISEALALQVRDVKLVEKKLDVFRTWTTDVTGKKILGSTKTRENRTIPISPLVASILEPLVSDKGPDEFLFVGHYGEALDYGYFRRAFFAPAVAKLGLGDATIHWLRHTCASMMIKIGAPITMISKILGHSSVKMTLDVYAHWFEDDSSDWMGRLGTHMSNSSHRD